jgi:hypothetical protein
MENSKKQLQIVYSHFFDCEKEPKPLPAYKAKFVMLCNWTAANDVINNPGNAPQMDDPSNEEIYWGANGNCVNQLFPGFNTILLPVSNLDQISVRCSQLIEGKRVYYTIFDEVENNTE